MNKIITGDNMINNNNFFQLIKQFNEKKASK